MNYEKLCIKCMHEKADVQKVCDYCGYDPSSYQVKVGNLPPFTILKARYLIGIVLKENPRVTSYVAMDLALERVVEIQGYRIREQMHQTSEVLTDRVLDSFDENNVSYLVLETKAEDRKEEAAKNNQMFKVVMASVAGVVVVAVLVASGLFLHQSLTNKNTDETATKKFNETVGETAGERGNENIKETETAAEASADTMAAIQTEAESTVSPTSQSDSKEGMIFPDSDSRYLTETEIEALKSRTDESYAQLLRYAINEIYARHGYQFKTDGQYLGYYNQYSWYRDIPNKHTVTEDELSECERANLNLLLKAESANGGDTTSGNTASGTIEINDYVNGWRGVESIQNVRNLVDAIGGMTEDYSEQFSSGYWTGNNLIIGCNNEPAGYGQDYPYFYIKNTGNTNITASGVRIGDSEASVNEKRSFGIQIGSFVPTYKNGVLVSYIERNFSTG